MTVRLESRLGETITLRGAQVCRGPSVCDQLRILLGATGAATYRKQRWDPPTSLGGSH